MVSDNGIGIDPQFLERIFIIFQRLLTGPNTMAQGDQAQRTAKKIAELHGGRI